jgi:hypothetical protein
MRVKFEKGSFVSIGGGEPAETYGVRTYFDTAKVTRRVLTSSQDPAAVEEDTPIFLEGHERRIGHWSKVLWSRLRNAGLRT